MALKRNYPETESPVSRTGGHWPLKRATRIPAGKRNGVESARILYLAPKMQVVENPFNPDYLRRLKDRDKEVTDHFDSYFRPRLRLKLHGHGLRHDVDDLIQDTLIRVLKAADNEEIHTPAAFGGYVSRVCDFVYYDWLSHHKKVYTLCVDVDELDIPDPAPGHDTLLLRRERQKQVAVILKSLRPKDRNLLRAKLFDELSPEEMCKRFGVSSDNLRVLLHRARKKFADAWKKKN
jgi:RNA polymerase sigma factor (sigma-70 family)